MAKTATSKKRKSRELFKHNKLSEAEGKWGKAVTNTLIDGGVVLVGGLVGATVGRFSLGAGFVLTTLGYQFNNSILSRFGLGLMASSVVGAVSDLGSTPSQAKGLEGVVDNAVYRAGVFVDDMSKKIWLDKAIEAVKGKDAGVQGLGYAQVYVEDGALAGFGNLTQDEQAGIESALNRYQKEQNLVLNQQALKGTSNYTLL